MADSKRFYYVAEDGWCGDFIPFYEDGIFHLFTIIGKEWRHLTTRDFVDFQEHGVALPSGGDEAQDQFVYTGSVIKIGTRYHIFYAGHKNDAYPNGLASEVVLHAESADLYTWEKKDDVFFAPDPDRYALDCWRDPIVFAGEDGYTMLLTGALKGEGVGRRGCIVKATSKDLQHWEALEPLYSPYCYDSLECPDYFQVGKMQYLIFSTYTRWWETQYRTSCDGKVWHTPNDEVFDGRAFYAARTVAANGRRFLIGWTALRKHYKDDEPYVWGGNLTVHELFADENGNVAVNLPPEIESKFVRPLPKSKALRYGKGEWSFSEEKIVGKDSGYSSVCIAEWEETCLIRTVIRIHSGAAGIVFRASYPKFDKWCSVVVDTRKRRLYFDRSNKYFNDQFFDEERPIELKEDGIYELKVVCYGSMIVCYLNGKTALSTRCFEISGDKIGLFVQDGEAEFLETQGIGL